MEPANEAQPPPSTVQPIVAPGAQDAQQIIAAQDQVMRQQDAQLDSISRSLGTMKNMGIQIRDELDVQNHLLDDIESGIDRTTGGLRSAQGRMAKLMRRSKDCKWICAILILFAVAVLLLVWVFRYNGKMP